MKNKYWRAYRSEEFQEEDIWEVIKQEDNTGFKNNDHLSSPHLISKRVPSAARMIPGIRKHQQIDENVHIVQSSAPVNIPDWSKIYGGTSRKKNIGRCSSSSLDHDDDDDDDDDKDGKLPPHEWLAKKFAKNQISSFSVCEGVGRTLKGRDLSRVRNAVLSKTGFL
ncbi:protein S40-6-like [Amaranthus tricolor]|uniref:protein S40-6-like n=1 Tax=Amaranthus tricolor TaxID=29722 RepID=UPI00258D1562|nr:protein S40-6-like [Amaranthus tricolor]